jgi:hypothetical protein
MAFDCNINAKSRSRVKRAARESVDDAVIFFCAFDRLLYRAGPMVSDATNERMISPRPVGNSAAPCRHRRRMASARQPADTPLRDVE